MAGKMGRNVGIAKNERQRREGEKGGENREREKGGKMGKQRRADRTEMLNPRPFSARPSFPSFFFFLFASC